MHFLRISGCKMKRQYLEKLTVVSTVNLFFWELERFSYNFTARKWHNIHINNSGICFFEVTKQILHTEEKMCYFILTPSSNESLNSHSRNINLSDKLHFQYLQAGTKMWKYSSQLLSICKLSYRQQGFIHLAIQFLQL
jgi:hypothetical protein